MIRSPFAFLRDEHGPFCLYTGPAFSEHIFGGDLALAALVTLGELLKEIRG